MKIEEVYVILPTKEEKHYFVGKEDYFHKFGDKKIERILIQQEGILIEGEDDVNRLIPFTSVEDFVFKEV